MANHARVSRNSSCRRPYAWLGAGAVGVGLALAGAGVAHADDTSTAAESSSARVSSSAAGAVASRPAAARSRAVASRSVRAHQSVSAAAASDRFTPARVAAVAGRRVPGVAVGAAVSSQVAAAAPTASAAAGVVPAAPSEASIAVTNWFSSTRSWLSGFDGPVAGAVQDVLYGVQRSLFSPAPTVKPIQFSTWTPGEPILGALQYVQPGGAAVGMQLSQAPTLGTVQLLSSGAYTYTPGPDFTGTDSFTADVTAGGFNLLEPLTPRTVSVVVDLNPGPPVQLTRGYDITNLSANGVYLSEIKKERGYEDSVVSLPVGTTLRPGETFHVEMTRWAIYDYTSSFVFTGCIVARCDLLPLPSGQEWTVRIMSNLLNDYEVSCRVGGYCSDRDGYSINAGSPIRAGFNAVVANLVDTRPRDWNPPAPIGPI